MSWCSAPVVGSRCMPEGEGKAARRMEHRRATAYVNMHTCAACKARVHATRKADGIAQVQVVSPRRNFGGRQRRHSFDRHHPLSL